MNNGIICPGQIKAKGGQKDQHSGKIRKIMLIEGMRNGKKCSRFDFLGRSSLPGCQLLRFLVNFIVRFPGTRWQVEPPSVVHYVTKVRHLEI